MIKACLADGDTIFEPMENNKPKFRKEGAPIFIYKDTINLGMADTTEFEYRISKNRKETGKNGNIIVITDRDTIV